MSQFIQQLANGIVIGGIYALSALGLTLVYGMMNIVNVAHGDFYMLGALFTYFATSVMGLPFILAVIFAVLLVWAMGMGVERVTLRSIRDYPISVTMLATFGLSLILQNVALIITGGVPKYINNPFPEASVSLGLFQMTPVRLFTTFVAVVVIIGIHLFLTKTAYGNAMRASFQDKDASLLAGINVTNIYMLTFGLGTGLAALGGSLIGIIAYVDPQMGAKGLMKCFVVVVFGGMGSIFGAICGGFILGIIEAMTVAYISSEYKDIIGFAVVIIFLLFRPSGLFGSRERKA